MRASVTAASGLSSCGSVSRPIGSIAVKHSLRYSAACEIFPDQRSNPCLLHWQTDSLPLNLQGSPQSTVLNHFSPNHHPSITDSRNRSCSDLYQNWERVGPHTLKTYPHHFIPNSDIWLLLLLAFGNKPESHSVSSSLRL